MLLLEVELRAHQKAGSRAQPNPQHEKVCVRTCGAASILVSLPGSDTSVSASSMRRERAMTSLVELQTPLKEVL